MGLAWFGGIVWKEMLILKKLLRAIASAGPIKGLFPIATPVIGALSAIKRLLKQPLAPLWTGRAPRLWTVVAGCGSALLVQGLPSQSPLFLVSGPKNPAPRQAPVGPMADPGGMAGVGPVDRLVAEAQDLNPAYFSAEEIRELQRRFGVHGAQPRLGQLFTKGLDHLAPLRAHTLARLEVVRPIVLEQSRKQQVNAMLMAAILFDEMQHAKPGDDIRILAESGLFQDHGLAQLSISELEKQGKLRPDASEAEVAAALEKLLTPSENVKVLAGQIARLQKLLGVPKGHRMEVSSSRRDAKIAATIAYLHNGKLDYPARILGYMQDPELHALMYSTRQLRLPPLI